MKKPLNLGEATIDANEIAAIKTMTDFDRERLAAATGTEKTYTVRITLMDNTTKHVEGFDLDQVVGAVSALGPKFDMVEGDGLAVRNNYPNVSPKYRPFGEKSDLPVEQRRFFSEVRIGPKVSIWLTTPYDKLENAGKAAPSLADLVAARPQGAPRTSGPNGFDGPNN